MNSQRRLVVAICGFGLGWSVSGCSVEIPEETEGKAREEEAGETETAKTFYVDVIGIGAERGSVSAGFRDTGSGSACEVTTVGACSLTTCSPNGTGERLPTTFRDAGKISVSFETETGALAAKVAPDAKGEYASAPLAGSGFLGGGEVGLLSAAGGEIAAFSTEIESPLNVLVTNVGAEIEGVAQALGLRRGEDFLLRWERGREDMTVAIMGESGEASLWCSFDSLVGEGTIAAAITEKLELKSELGVYWYTEKHLAVGRDDIDVRVIGAARTETKKAIVELEVVE